MPAPVPHEILPGVLHWTTLHEGIDAPVSSYAVVPAGVVIDPRVLTGEIDGLRDRVSTLTDAFPLYA